MIAQNHHGKLGAKIKAESEPIAKIVRQIVITLETRPRYKFSNGKNGLRKIEKSVIGVLNGKK
jgi:hypothetical protein